MQTAQAGRLSYTQTMKRKRLSQHVIAIALTIALALLGKYGHINISNLFAEAATSNQISVLPTIASTSNPPKSVTTQNPPTIPLVQTTSTSPQAEQPPIQPPPAPQQPTGDTAIVARVIDGDTIELDSGEKVRYLGMDTPEITKGKNECFGHEAAAKNSDLVLGKTVRLTKDVSNTDRYGRLLRFVWIGEILVNAEMLKQGYAAVLTIPPDVAKANEFKALQANARSAGIGLWGSCGSVHAKATP